MDQKTLLKMLDEVRDGEMTPDEALLKLRKEPYTELGYAKVDHHRKLRQGAAEVIYGAGKTKEQILGIAKAMLLGGEETILITRMDREKADYLRGHICAREDAEADPEGNPQVLPGKEENAGSDAAEASGRCTEFRYEENARIGIIGTMPKPDGRGRIVVATGGTSDIPVAEEAALTAEVLGNEVVRLYDVGVAGLHRLLDHLDELMGASVIIAIAGMEGALASVIGGLADCPVIAVPTSVGYGASFHGLSALLSMLNSCASGVSVVNIDNGFGAGYQASMINHAGMKT